MVCNGATKRPSEKGLLRMNSIRPMSLILPLCKYAEINNFHQFTLDQVKKFAALKSCELDPLLKTCLPVILPTLNSIINMSLANGIMPYALKVAVLKLLLKKKPDADTSSEQIAKFPSNLKAEICVQAKLVFRMQIFCT